jgi:hypothetical protein
VTEIAIVGTNPEETEVELVSDSLAHGLVVPIPTFWFDARKIELVAVSAVPFAA